MLPRRVEQVPRDGLREVAIGLLDQQAILEVEYVAVEGQLVAVAGVVQQQRRLADQVEREVGEADVDLERRAVPAPFAEPLSQHQRVIAQTQQIVDAGSRLPAGASNTPAPVAPWCLDGGRTHHMCFTSSGMS